jgi:hypothetical protein
MTKAERIKALVGRKNNPVKDEKILTAASDDGLKALEDHADTLDKADAEKEADAEVKKKVKEDADAREAAKGKFPPKADGDAEDKADGGADEDTENADGSKKAAPAKGAKGHRTAEEAEKELSEEEWLGSAPASIRDMVARHKAADARQKADLVGRLKTAQKVYTEAQLKTKSVEQLQEIAALVKVEVPTTDFSGQAGPRAAEGSGDDYLSQPPPDGYRIALDKRAAAAAAGTKH